MAATSADRIVGMPLTEALRSDRWCISDPLSLAYHSRRDNITFRFWLFSAVANTNITKHLVVAWGSGSGRRQLICCYGGDTDEIISLAGTEIRHHMQLEPGDTFTQTPEMRRDWSKFVTEHLSIAMENKRNRREPRGTEERTVDTMLRYVEVLGDLLFPNACAALARLSGPGDSRDRIQLTANICNMLGHLCRDKELEAVYWPVELWNRAMEGKERYIGTDVSEASLPAGPHLWYPEEAIPVLMASPQDAEEWMTPSWRMAAMALIPWVVSDAPALFTLCVFEHISPSPDDYYDNIPRIVNTRSGFGGHPCGAGYETFMAGIEFMRKHATNVPNEYDYHELRLASKRREKLQPYSVLELPRPAPPADPVPDGYRYDLEPGMQFVDIERKLTYVDANTGEWLNYAGNGAPTTDEEAELVLPRPPKYSSAALDAYYRYRGQGQSIMDALYSTMQEMDDAGLM